MDEDHRMDEQKSFAALHAWFLTQQGRDVGMAFANELRSGRFDDRGQKLLQLGQCGDNTWLHMLAFRDKWVLSPSLSTHTKGVVSSIGVLPFERESMDCIIAPLTLETYGCNKNPLDEIDRILKPMGYVIFMGINPWSFWGASLRWGHLSCFGHLSSAFSSSLSVKHAMVSRGYQQCSLSSFYYLPPVESEYWLRKLEFLNQMSKMVWSYPAGFYCLMLQKYDPCMTALSRPVSHDMRLVQI